VLRLKARDGIAARHAIARFELDTQYASGDRRSNDESIAHARTPLFVDGHDECAVRDRRQFYAYGSRPECDGREAGDKRCGQEHATVS
jgi:hypothetical protein